MQEELIGRVENQDISAAVNQFFCPHLAASSGPNHLVVLVNDDCALVGPRSSPVYLPAEKDAPVLSLAVDRTGARSFSSLYFTPSASAR